MKIHIRFHDTIIFSPVKIHLHYGDETSLIYALKVALAMSFHLQYIWRRICGVEKNCEESFQLLKTIFGPEVFFIFCVVKFHLRKIRHRHWFEMMERRKRGGTLARAAMHQALTSRMS